MNTNEKTRITKKRLIHEVNNDKCHNWYYEYRFRVYTDRNTYFKGNFVQWFDVSEVCEYFDADSVTKKQIAEYADVLGCNFLDSAPSVVTQETMRPFFAMCRETVENYNGVVGW